MQLQYNDAPAAPSIPKALQVGPNSLLTALAKCKREHAGVQIRAKEEVERRHFAKIIRQMEKASKKTAKAKQKMEQHRGKTKGKTVKTKAYSEAYDHQTGFTVEGEFDAIQTGQVFKPR